MASGPLATSHLSTAPARQPVRSSDCRRWAFSALSHSTLRQSQPPERIAESLTGKTSKSRRLTRWRATFRHGVRRDALSSASESTLEVSWPQASGPIEDLVSVRLGCLLPGPSRVAPVHGRELQPTGPCSLGTRAAPDSYCIRRTLARGKPLGQFGQQLCVFHSRWPGGIS